MLARLSAFVIWALVAASVVFWGLRLLVRAPAAPAYAVPVGEGAAVRGDLTRLLGGGPVTTAAAVPMPEASSRFKLLGIVAPRSSSSDGGVALIAVDGKLPKAFVVGSRLDGDLVLQSVSLRTASIGAGAGAPAITLELPPPTAATTGKLPAGGTPVPSVPPVPTIPSSPPPQTPYIQPQPTLPGLPAPIQPGVQPMQQPQVPPTPAVLPTPVLTQ